jgi:hypothetical protein
MDISPLGQCDDLPFAREAVVLSKLDYIELKSQLNFYKAQHERALAREERQSDDYRMDAATLLPFK